MIRPIFLLLAVLAAGCGGDDDVTDHPPSDAALGADSSEVLPDAGVATPCGEEPVMFCDRATEICIEKELGAGIIYECAELPVGCDAVRDCASCSAACEEPADACADTDRDNTLSCACLECV